MSTTTASSALQPCGFSRETLMELLKKHNKTDLYNHFFFKATTKEVIPEIYEKHENTMLTHPDLDRCQECGCTIAEHPSTDIRNHEPCGLTREELDNLKKAIKKEELDYNDFFFKAASAEVIPKHFRNVVATMLVCPDLDRCKECGCTIDEHPLCPGSIPTAEHLPTTANSSGLKPCARTQDELDFLLEKHYNTDLFSRYFFVPCKAIPDRLKKHADIIRLNGDLDCCQQCGCTIDEHPLCPGSIPTAEHLPTTANSSGLKPCALTKDELDFLLEKHYNTDLFSRYFFVPCKAIPGRLKKHADIIRLNGDLDCCQQCGCTIAEHPDVKPAVCPHGIPAVYREENYPLFFKNHLHESGIFRQFHGNHEMLDSASCHHDVPASHSFTSKSHEMLVDHCCDRGFMEIWHPVEDSNYKCGRSCMATHVYPHTGLSWVDDLEFPTKFLWLVPHETPPYWYHELKNYHLWKAAASYIGYVLRYFGEAPDGTPLTVQESIQHHVRGAEVSPLPEVSPSQRSNSSTAFSSSPAKNAGSTIPSDSANVASPQTVIPPPVQLLVCQLGSERFGLNHFVKQEDEDEDNNLTVYTCNIVERGGVYCGEWTTGGDLPFLFNRTGNSSYVDGTESSSECCSDGSRSDLGSIVVDGSRADDHHCACEEEDEDDEARTLPSSEFVADESTPPTADHVESIIVGQLREAKHAAATEPSSAVSVWVLEDHNHHLNGMLHRLSVVELRKLCRKYSVGRGRSRVSEEFHVRGRIEKALDNELQQLLLESPH